MPEWKVLGGLFQSLKGSTISLMVFYLASLHDYFGFEFGGNDSSLVCHLSFSLVIGESLEYFKI